MKLLKRVLIALLLSLAMGVVLGTALRLHIERSVYYIGSAAPPHPFDVRDARASILDASDHEEQIG